MPSARLIGAVALNTLLLSAGLLVPWLVLAALVLDGLLLAAFLIDFRRAASEAVTADRRWPPMLVQGAETTLVVEVASRSPRPVTVRLRDGLAPALAARAARQELTLPAAGRSRWEQRLVPRRRGEHSVAPLTARVLGPWGLAWAQRDLVAPEFHRIFPQVRWGGRVGQLLALAQRRSLGVPDCQLLGLGSELYALREYLPGDPLNRIHWKATARHRRLVSREETWERGARLVILLDAARTMASMDGNRSKLDHALAAALALTRVAAARGDRVTVIAFSDRVERVVRASSRMAEVYGRLYDCEATLEEPAYDLAVEAALRASPRQATVMMFTSVVDLAAGELLGGALLRLEQRRHRPILLNLQDPELAALAEEPPAEVPDAYAQATALEILLANRRLTRRMRAAGVRMVQPMADRLPLAALDSYLEIFRRTA